MSFIEWQAAYETGLTKVDEQHRHLVGLINRLEAVVHRQVATKEVHEVLIALVEYTQYHFAEEEKLMAEHNFPGLDEHAEMHLTFVHQVAAFLQKLKNGREVAAGDILPFLKSWLINHILREDKKLSIMAPIGRVT